MMNSSASVGEQPQRRLVGAMHALPCVSGQHFLHNGLQGSPQRSCAAQSLFEKDDRASPLGSSQPLGCGVAYQRDSWATT
eukprot:351776-Chlamydomonas_euryale.AAC.4